MRTRIGTCGNCGGDVYGHTGPWHGVNPPPPPSCVKCGAVVKGHDDVLPMGPPRRDRWEASKHFPGPPIFSPPASEVQAICDILKRHRPVIEALVNQETQNDEDPNSNTSTSAL